MTFKSTIKNTQFYQALSGLKKKLVQIFYSSKKLYILSLPGNDKKIYFSTEDPYSKSWFYPRYSGGKIHEKNITLKFIELASFSRCFFDIGANLGWYTSIACKYMHDGLVFSFEMDSDNFDLLKRNVDINAFSNAQLYHNAVSDKSGFVKYKKSEQSADLRLTSDDKFGGVDHTDCIEVKSIIIDDFVASVGCSPDLFKIDVEGAEMNVLKGMKKVLIHHKPILFLEIHPENLSEFDTSVSEILDFLKSMNYKIFEIPDARQQFSSSELRIATSEIEKNSMLLVIPDDKSVI